MISKRGDADFILFLISLIIAVGIAFSLFQYVGLVNKGGIFEKKFLARDIAVSMEAVQAGVGGWNFMYPSNLSDFHLKIKLNKSLIYVQKNQKDTPTLSWYSNNTALKWEAFMKDISLKHNHKTDVFVINRAPYNNGSITIKMMIGDKGPMSDFGFIWPVQYPIITSPFGPRQNPFDASKKDFHPGIDIVSRNNIPNVPIIAVANGTVIKVRTSCHGNCNTFHLGYGNFVYIDHGQKDGYDVRSFYAHMSKVLVNTGDKVTQGQILGYMGSTGLSTAKHLHFEVILNGKNYDPMNYLPSLSVKK